MTTTYSAKSAFQSASQRLRVLDNTAVSFTKSRAVHAAASLAYYTFFSIFPLMLLFILVGSYFLDRQSMLQRVTQAVQSILPISQQFVVQNLEQVLKQRAAVGVFVLVSLLWSASNVFNNLAYEINMAWPEAKARNFWRARLIGLDMIAGLTALLILSVVLDSLAKFLAGPGVPGTPLANVSPWGIVSSLGSWIAVFLLYLAMYHWVPTVHVPWSASFWGALAASIGWKAATTGFAWYLSSPFARYELVYGSLGAIVAFLFLIYIIALVTLFGAHLTAAVDRLHRQRMQARAAQVTPNTGHRSKQQTDSQGTTAPDPEPGDNTERDSLEESDDAEGDSSEEEAQSTKPDSAQDSASDAKARSGYPAP